MRRSPAAISHLFIIGVAAVPSIHAADTAPTELDRTFSQTVRPFLNTYCAGCHSGATPAAQFDLQPYTNVAAVVRDYPRWNLVLEKLTAREMPPKPLKQPPDDA